MSSRLRKRRTRNEKEEFEKESELNALQERKHQSEIQITKNSSCEEDDSDSEYETLDEETADEYSAEFTDEEDDTKPIVVDREERQSGDGEEKPPETTKLDDDEDKKNPAYIPRTGYFYEHDDRKDDLIDENKVEKVVNIKETKTNKSENKSLQEKKKWEHDRYNEQNQSPKSRTQIVAEYGYDIRSKQSNSNLANNKPSKESNRHKVSDETNKKNNYNDKRKAQKTIEISKNKKSNEHYYDNRYNSYDSERSRKYEYRHSKSHKEMYNYHDKQQYNDRDKRQHPSNFQSRNFNNNGSRHNQQNYNYVKNEKRLTKSSYRDEKSSFSKENIQTTQKVIVENKKSYQDIQPKVNIEENNKEIKCEDTKPKSKRYSRQRVKKDDETIETTENNKSENVISNPNKTNKSSQNPVKNNTQSHYVPNLAPRHQRQLLQKQQQIYYNQQIPSNIPPMVNTAATVPVNFVNTATIPTVATPILLPPAVTQSIIHLPPPQHTNHSAFVLPTQSHINPLIEHQLQYPSGPIISEADQTSLNDLGLVHRGTTYYTSPESHMSIPSGVTYYQTVSNSIENNQQRSVIEIVKPDEKDNENNSIASSNTENIDIEKKIEE